MFLTDDPSLRYRLGLRRRELCDLLATWQCTIPSLAYLGLDCDTLPEWGPTETELADCRLRHVTASYAIREDSNDGEIEDELMEEVDEEDFNTLEAVERADLYRNTDQIGYGNYWADGANPFEY